MFSLGSSHYYIDTAQTERAVNRPQNWTKWVTFTFSALTEIRLIIIMVPFDLKYLRAAYNWEIIGTGWWKLINFIWWEKRFGNKTILMWHEATKSWRVECQSKNHQMRLEVYGATVGVQSDFLDLHRVKGEKLIKGANYVYKTAKIDHMTCILVVSLPFPSWESKLNEEVEVIKILNGVESEPHSMFLVFYLDFWRMVQKPYNFWLCGCSKLT